jgi:Zn-dependent M28 family amino/carboxypeptidase
MRPVVPRRSRRVLAGTAGAAAVVLLATAAGPALAAPPVSTNANNNTSEKLRRAVSAEDVLAHQRVLQGIADRNGDTRASGTPGYDQSVDYVVGQMRGAGYDVEVQPFEFPFFQELAPAVLQRVSPSPATFTTATFTYSGSGDVTAGVVPVDLDLEVRDVPASSPLLNSGCEAADFAGFTAGSIALVRRGSCPFGQKAANAQAAGASAVIVMGNLPGAPVVAGTLGGPGTTIPVVGASFADGEALAAGGTVARVFASTDSRIATTYNVIAESRTGNPDNVVMAGAHLDSVVAGPGINDNGSGSAAILETALELAKTKPTNQLRFAWWGAEELGLLGSEFYVDSLSQAERDRIALYLNFDMVGSPNYVRFVYDGDDSVGDGNVGPAGSAAIEKLFVDYFASQGLASDPTDFSGRSDYGPFIAAGVGIPSGGLFTGAEGVKTARQAEIYGGVAGVAYDPCYHQACDSLDANTSGAYAQLVGLNRLVGNVSLKAQEEMSDAIAHAVITYAYSTQTVNGVVGAKGKGKTRVAGSGSGGSAGTADGSGGGLHDGHDHEELPAA